MDELEKLHSKRIKRNVELITVCGQPKIDNIKKVATKSAQLTKDLMIEFAVYCRNIASREGAYGVGFTGNWELHREQKIVTTEQLLEMFLKEKYGNQD